MVRSVVLFGALFFTGLVAGAAFAVWFDYNPSGMSPGFYIESMQHAIHVFTVPLPSIVLPSVLFTGASCVLARRERFNFYILAAGFICTMVVGLVTAFGNVPINNQIEMWTAASPPPNWSELAGVWWRFQSVRTIAALSGLALMILACLNSRRTTKDLPAT